MKIAILGTRGIPNYHGGFEQFAESLSEYLVSKNHDVTVYNSHKHPYKESVWQGVNIVHKYDPEYRIGTSGQFIYDLNCITHSRRQNFDVILQLGYTSSSIWNGLFDKKTTLVTNMDGLEWKRSKYNKPTQRFLKYAEKLAIKYSDCIVADSLGIKEYLDNKYKLDSEYIAYGSKLFEDPKEELIAQYNVEKGDYNMLIARLEPENNIEVILDGVSKSKSKKDFLVIGKHETKFGNYLKDKYKNHPSIKFLGGVYNQNHLDNLRYFSNLYFHGHSVGGTNPSLLEAMGSKAFIIAHNNIFNKSILKENAFYFESDEDIIKLMSLNKKDHLAIVEQNFTEIRNKFSSDYINSKYENYLEKCLLQKHN
ncbi:DUF1972 domain-containing protein [Winogradskyella undariae]|uniref:DUF1972 domain-containing protein n=1 Tax=Winogradskyella undariae TaxID=1285465 RepID=UPI00156B72E4|nr:DUF1972 domain-containing protein [Winogradskyella undariae]NRR91477.1 DUF1972 domain-containing protein [Winogradskyella undariae]